jgi:hypothetical protein
MLIKASFSCAVWLYVFTAVVRSGAAEYDPKLQNPMYSINGGPRVVIDEGHNNNVADGRWLPFRTLLQKDGYRVSSLTNRFTQESLRDARILVIANALATENKTNRALPTFGAFRLEEIETLDTWVKAGGSLFLLAGHMPWPGAAERLAERFGVFFQNGFAFPQDPESGELVMSRDADRKKLARYSFKNHPILIGRSSTERISFIDGGCISFGAWRLSRASYNTGGTLDAFVSTKTV